MDIDLRDVPAKVISIPGKRRRRRHIEAHMGQLGINFEFVDGIVGERKIPSVALAHTNAFKAATSLPFMVFEDGIEFCGEGLVLKNIPEDADIIYLGKNPDGCMPNTPENVARFRHRSLPNIALASVYDDRWLRLHSMVSAHAILFITDLARERCLEAQRISRVRVTPMDVRYAYLMKELNVYAPLSPVFREAADLQVLPDKKPRRPTMTHGPFLTATIGDVRETSKQGAPYRVKVVRSPLGHLEWEIIE